MKHSKLSFNCLFLVSAMMHDILGFDNHFYVKIECNEPTCPQENHIGKVFGFKTNLHVNKKYVCDKKKTLQETMIIK